MKSLVRIPGYLSIFSHRLVSVRGKHWLNILRYDQHAPQDERCDTLLGTALRSECGKGWTVAVTYYTDGMDPFGSPMNATGLTVTFTAPTLREAALGAVAGLPASGFGRARAIERHNARLRDARMAAEAAAWKPPRRGLQLDAEDARAAGTPATAVDAVAEGLRMWHGLG